MSHPVNDASLVRIHDRLDELVKDANLQYQELLKSIHSGQETLLQKMHETFVTYPGLKQITDSFQEALAAADKSGTIAHENLKEKIKDTKDLIDKDIAEIRRDVNKHDAWLTWGLRIVMLAVIVAVLANIGLKGAN